MQAFPDLPTLTTLRGQSIARTRGSSGKAYSCIRDCVLKALSLGKIGNFFKKIPQDLKKIAKLGEKSTD